MENLPNQSSGVDLLANPSSPSAQLSPGANSPLYGVGGWLKLFVVVNLYVGPVFFVLRQILAWIGFSRLSERYPGIVLVGAVELIVGGFLVVRAIQMAKDLRDIKPRAVQGAKALLRLALIWTFVDIPISFLSGLKPGQLMPGILKGTLVGVVGFAIWYSYFNVSKRVQATYPDWKS